MRLSIFLFALILLSSCSVNDKSYAESRAAMIEREDIKLINTTSTLSHKRNNPIYIQSSSMSYWIDEDRIEVENMSFIQNDEEGNISLRGSADSATIDSNSEVIHMRGNVRLESLEDQLSIISENLIFDTEEQTVEAEGYVEVVFDSGSVSGYNLSGNLDRMHLDLGITSEGEVYFE